MIWMSALGLGIGLGHIRPFLGFAVVVRPVAVVDVARRIDPNQARTASRRLRHCSSLRRRGRLRRWSWSRSSRRSRGWSLCYWRWSRRRGRGCCRSLRLCRRSRRVPLLHALMPPTCPLFAGGCRIRSILALTGRACRCLRRHHLRGKKPRRHRHQTNRYLHKRSRQKFEFHGPNTAKSYAIQADCVISEQRQPGATNTGNTRL